MKPSNELFNLIQSLSKSEKRFFKLSSSLQDGDKNYLKLFDYIEKQKKYDEAELKNHFQKEKFIKFGLMLELKIMLKKYLMSLKIFKNHYNFNFFWLLLFLNFSL